MIEPSDLDTMPSDEYELDAPTTKPGPQATPTPLPRMWKADDSDPEIRANPTKKAPPESSGSGIRSPRESKPTKPGQASAPTVAAEDSDKKKVLVEETPEWDTYETRQRARLFLGAAMASILFFLGLIVYRMLFPSPEDPDDLGNGALAKATAPTAAPNLDLEARTMIERAKEHEKEGRRGESVALLNKVIKVYSKVPSAKVAQDALARAKADQPLFPERPPTPIPLTERAAPPPDGIPAAVVPPDPARGIRPTPPPPDFNQTRPPDAARGLAMATPATTNPAPSTAPTPASLTPSPAKPAEAVPAKSTVRTLPKGFQARTEMGLHESGWPKMIESEFDHEPMIFIPEGTFIMGANGGALPEEPAHKVQLRPYYIDQHEVTIWQFDKFLDASRHRYLLPKNWIPGDGRTRPDNKNTPVTMVTYKDADAYASWSNRQIPTEAQWEMAARSEQSHLYPWGPDPITWDKPRVVRKIEPVMSYAQDVTPLGVFDLAGNVAEWTQDWFDGKFFQQFADRTAIDPTGPAKGSRSLQRVVKGASKTWHVSYREGIPQEKRLSYVGFRCVLNLESDTAPTPPATPEPPRPSTGRPNLTPIPPPF